MSVVKRQPTAEEDLFETWSYIADDSIREADKLIRKISETLLLLADNPRMGSRREELAEGLRAFPVKSYMIYYRPHGNEEGIVVIRVLNATQYITELYFEQKGCLYGRRKVLRYSYSWHNNIRKL